MLAMDQEGSSLAGNPRRRLGGAYEALVRRETAEKIEIARMLAQLDRDIEVTQRQMAALRAVRESWRVIIEERVGGVAALTEGEFERQPELDSQSEIEIPLALSYLLNRGRTPPAPSSSSRSEGDSGPCDSEAPAVFASSSSSASSSAPRPTTLTVRNIPARYSQEGLLEEFAPRSTVDFFYLPYCLRTKKTTGSAYINFISYDATLDFVRAWHGRFLRNVRKRGRERPLDIVYSQVQGYQRNMERSVGLLDGIKNDSMLPLIMQGGVRLSARAELEATRALVLSAPRSDEADKEFLFAPGDLQ